jgi:sigma-B regulation protein RsbU (phosphoserine phosphatase)
MISEPKPFPGPNALEAAADSSPVKVLLIEDSPNDARLICEMLLDTGGNSFALEHVNRLSAGLARLAQGGIGLVLTDLSLPDSHGLDAFIRAHAQAPQVPIIVLSGLEDETVAVSAVHEGAQDYLVKGHVDGHLLVRAMRYAIERKRTAEQLAAYAAELREKNSQLEADLNMAREIQQVFLPQQFPTFPPGAAPADSALRFYHRYEPASAVGGDFFNVFAVSDTVAGVFICDVMGHGLRAALVTAIMRGLVEELVPATAADPGQFLTELNHSLQVILSRMEEPIMATAFYLTADVGRSELRFASAGHPSPLRLRRSAGTVDSLRDCDGRQGPALGLFAASVYPTCRCDLAANDLLVLFTDGLYEVEGAAHTEFGLRQLREAVRRRTALPAAKLFDEVLDEVKRFSARHEFEDDVCLVGVEVMRTGLNAATP